MSNPLVSVIIPTFNCAQFVRDAIDSVLQQDYQPIEVLVVDDGSTDGTVEVLSSYGERITLLQQANRGPAAARNRAVREARGDYLAFLDGDDLWLRGHTGALMSHVMAHPESKVVFGDWLVWPANPDGSYSQLALPEASARPDVDPASSGSLYSRLLFDSVVHIIASLIHRSVYDTVGGFDESLRTGSDYDFWLRVSRQFRITKLGTSVAVYRQNLSSVTNTIRLENNPYRLLKRALDTYGLSDQEGNAVAPGEVQRRLADLAFLHGYRHYWSGDAKTARDSFALALAHRRWHPKAAAYMVASMARQLLRQQPKRRLP